MIDPEWLFAYAMGEITGSCLTCDFIGYFMTSFMKFSSAVYDFFAAGFPIVVPMLLLIWIASRVIKLVTTGGEDGLSFLKDIAMKFALFAVIWIAITGTPDRWVWRTLGPDYLSYSLDAATGLRESAFRMSSIIGDGESESGNATGPYSAPLKCGEVRPAVENVALTGDFSFVQTGIEMTCFTERSHMIGISSGVAVIFSGFGGSPNGDDNSGLVQKFFTGAFKVVCGLLLIALFSMSCVWMVFLMLDVIVEIAIIAALSPILAATALWKPSRQITIAAIKKLGGSMVTALAVTIVTVLSYFLMSNVINIYNAMNEVVSANFQGLQMPDIPVTSGPDGRIEAMRIFVARTQETDSSQPIIPMTFAAPWFLYLCLVGIATYALGKKLIAMIAQIMEMGGQSEMANNAVKMGRSGLVTSAVVGGAMVAGIATAGVALVKGAPLLAAGGVGALKGGAGVALKGAAKFGGSRMMSGARSTAANLNGAKNALGRGSDNE